MNELDDELRRVLRREDPPPGFAERVMRRVETRQPEQRMDVARPSVMRWAAAAMLVAALGGGLQYRAVQQQRERIRGEAAKEQVMKALRITADKLQVVQSAVKEIGS
jgi:phosphopantetheinyl transferase (holo-ACP synthase)